MNQPLGLICGHTADLLVNNTYTRVFILC